MREANLLANDSDVDLNVLKLGTIAVAGSSVAPLPIDAAGTTVEGTYGFLTVKDDGTYSYAVKSAAVGAIATGTTVTDSFGYTAVDGQGGSSGATLVVSVEDTKLVGGDGDDKLVGTAADDIIRGGIGADDIRGGEGSDILRGGKGDDMLYGGDGADTFVFSDGTDRVHRFDADEDTLELSSDLWEGDLAAAEVIEQFGRVRSDRVVLDFGDDVVKLYDVTFDELTSAIDIV